MSIVTYHFEVSESRKAYWQSQLEKHKSLNALSSIRSLDMKELSELAPEFDTKALTEDLYLFELEDTEALIASIESTNAEVRSIKGFDALLRMNKKLWPRVYTRAALRYSIVRQATVLDTKEAAYVTGVGTRARAVISVLVELGYSRICMVWPDQQEAEKVIQEFKRNFFLVDIKWLADRELTLQPNNGSILVNTRPHEAGSVLVDDLSYLNFLQSQGLVVEFYSDGKPNKIIQEAQNIGQRIVSPELLMGAYDAYLWADILSVEEDSLKLRFVEDWVQGWMDQLKTKV